MTLDHPVLQTLAWTLLHFLWQGALLGLATKAGLWLLRGRAPQARYLLGCAGLLAMAVAPVATFLLLKPAADPASGTALVEMTRTAAQAPASTAWMREFNHSLRPLLPWAVGLWMAGVSVLSLRLVGGWFWLLRLRTRLAEPAGACWQMTVNALARRMRVNLDVKILRSWAVDTLMVVGWIKPLILVPAAALANLPPEALEAVLAHELAHVRRHDYLVNLVQSVLEVLLFYHPAVWWVSAQIRQERELCCDDAAVALCGDPVLYARALAALESLRGDALPATRLAPAAHGGTLMNRIQRLLSPTLPPSPTRRAGVLAALAVTALGAGTVLHFQETPKKSEAKSTRMNIQVREDGSRLRVKSQGEVKVRPDAKTDLALADGASFAISDSEKDTVRRFTATREKGVEKRTYTVNGKEAPVDQAWLDARLNKIKQMEQRAVEAEAKAKTAEGKAKEAEAKAKRIEVRVRRLGEDGQEIVTEDVHELVPGEGPGKKRIVIKQHGDGPAEIEELRGPGKVMVVKGSGGKVLRLDPQSGEEKVIVIDGTDSKKLHFEAQRLAEEARLRARQMKLRMKDLDGLQDRLKELKPDFDFDFDFDFDDEDAPKVFRWNSKTPDPEHREKLKELQRSGQQKEMDVLRREIERLQQRLDRLQQRMHGEGVPPPPPPAPPRTPKPSKAPIAPPSPAPKASAAPPAPPATPAPTAPMAPPKPPPPPGSTI